MLEREFKFYLKGKKIREELDTLAEKSHYTVFEITQGYLPNDARLRHRRVILQDGLRPPTTNATDEYFHTIKYRAEHGMIEIENQISQFEFDELMPLTNNTVVKVRYLIFESPDEQWEVDFFYGSKRKTPYLVLAECEVSETRVPMSMPDVVAKYLSYEVPFMDKAWTNRKLDNPKKVAALLKSLGLKG